MLEAFPNHPKIQQQLVMNSPFTLHVVNQKRLYHRLADWYEERPLTSVAFIAAWPTYQVLAGPQSGYS